MSLSVARSTDSDGVNTRYMRGGWSRAFGNVYVGASLEYDTGSQNNDFDDQVSGSQKRFYLTVSIPLGQGRSLNSYFNNTGNGSRLGTRFSDRPTRDFGWSLASENDFGARRTSGTGSMDVITPVSQLSGSISSDNSNYTTWSAHASGGVVAHDNGVTFSPNRIGDTFGIAKVGEESGVRMDTPGGPAWTDSRGYAVLPTLTGYKQSTIQLDTRTLAKNVDINNAWQGPRPRAVRSTMWTLRLYGPDGFWWSLRMHRANRCLMGSAFLTMRTALSQWLGAKAVCLSLTSRPVENS